MKIAMGADHGGFELKEAVHQALTERGIEVEDLGCHDTASVDYPDFAAEVAARVAQGTADQGLLVCTTGLGMSIAANKFPHVRAALCLTPLMAEKARTHNNANVLVLGGGQTGPAEARRILDAWLANGFSDEERHARRVAKLGRHPRFMVETAQLFEYDREAWDVVCDEDTRQRTTLDLIASENHVSPAVRQAQASVLTNKYAEGYPQKRWYQGCRNMDRAESLALDRVRRVFGTAHANVQPHCGSSANMAVYFAALEPGDTILTMSLAHGGHLTHGHGINFSGRLFRVVHYGVDRASERIDYEQLAELARAHRPRLIVAGASAYPRTIDFARFAAVAADVGARLMVDMAHIAGLVAAGSHPSPVPHADFVTGTTHKTLRGPRGGLILCGEGDAAAIDRQVFPGIQGGPEMHTILAKAVCFHEAGQPEFAAYGRQVVANAQALAEGLQARGYRLVSGGTDNHLVLVDVSPRGMTGQTAAAALERAGLVLNKNAIPFDTHSPLVTSGIRIGTPAVTTRGMREPEMAVLVNLIDDVLEAVDDGGVAERTCGAVCELAASFPVP